MSAAGYAVREIERRQISAQSVADDRSLHSDTKERGGQQQSASLTVHALPTSEKRRVKRSEGATDGNGKGTARKVVGITVAEGGYLNQHIEDEEEDRRIKELEREVAALEPMVSVGRSGGGKPRASSANPSRRRPPGDGGRPSHGGDATPSSESSKRSASAGRPYRPTKKLSNAQQVLINAYAC